LRTSRSKRVTQIYLSGFRLERAISDRIFVRTPPVLDHCLFGTRDLKPWLLGADNGRDVKTISKSGENIHRYKTGHSLMQGRERTSN
jgi:hypothetical protein